MLEAEKILIYPDEDIRPLMPAFLEGLGRGMAALAEALERGDWERILALAHLFKGQGGSFGCDEVTRLGGLLDEAGRERRLGSARLLARELDEYVSRLELAPERR